MTRVWAAVSEGLVLSKLEGAAWAAPRLPPKLAAVVAAALAVYTGQAVESPPISCEAALAAVNWIRDQREMKIVGT